MSSKHIMLIGIPSDVVLQHFAQFISKKYCKVIYINQNELGRTINLDSKYWYLPRLGKVPHTAISGIYNRCMGFDPTIKIDAKVLNANAFLSGMLDYEYSKVINRPSAMLSNNSKPLQSYLLRDVGLEMPESVCIANARIEKYSGNIIYKSICAIRSIVKKLEVDYGTFVKEPLLLQQVLTGYNVRVHVVGSQIFATKITSKTIDYRYCKHSRHEVYDLPIIIKNICYKIAVKLNLLFCGIDLICMHNKYYLLEVNTAPGYSYFEKTTPENNISTALYKLLGGRG